MGSTPSKQICSDPNIPYQVYRAATYSSGKLNSSKHQPLYKPIIEQQAEITKGTIVSGNLAEIQCGGMLASIFGLHHAFVVFEFSSKIWIRCEVSNYQDGTAIFISRIKKFSYVNERQFSCTTKGLTIQDVIDWANQFYQKGDYHIERRNCYDFVAFMLSRDFQGADAVTKKWKRLEIQKVPSLLRD